MHTYHFIYVLNYDDTAPLSASYDGYTYAEALQKLSKAIKRKYCGYATLCVKSWHAD